MVLSRKKSDVQNNGGQPGVTKDHGIQKQAVRRSARLEAIRSCKQSIPKSNFIQETQTLPSIHGTSNVPVDEKACRKKSTRSLQPHKATSETEARARNWRIHSTPSPASFETNASPSSFTPEDSAADDISETNTDPLSFWNRTGRWPKKYFEQDSRIREDFERGKSQKEFDQRYFFKDHPHLCRYFAQIRSLNSPSYKESESRLQTPSDQLPRDFKIAPYRRDGYMGFLEGMGSYMRDSEDGCKQECLKELLYSDQTVPQDSLFRNDLFDEICKRLRPRKEAFLIQHITRLIVPSVVSLKIYRAKHLNHLYECVNEGWNTAIPFCGPRPQPDYSVGFDKSAFTEQQRKKIEPFICEIYKNWTATNYFMATFSMYFPFLTCEVADGDRVAVRIADLQNAHSMTVAVRGVVELYKAVKRVKELHREILAFSISHDALEVGIYGHYATIEGEKATFYRHCISLSVIASPHRKDRWIVYKFTKNVYDIWMPIHHKRICSAIDDLPDTDFSLSEFLKS